MSVKPLTPEMVRILRAVAEGRVVANEHGRYVIDGEPRPDYRSRQLLKKRGLIIDMYVSGAPSSIYQITPRGKRRLAEVEA